MKTEQPLPDGRDATPQPKPESSDQDFDWIEALVDKFQDSGRPARELRRAWSRAVIRLA